MTEKKDQITPDTVLSLTQPTDGYLCPLDANIYNIEFIYFRIRNYDTNQTLCQIKKKPQQIGKPISENMRTIKYHFGPAFFQLKNIGTTLSFKVGQKPLKNFKMVERHYFKKQLIKSYQFDAPFCMPNSVNDMEAIYELPDLSQQKINQMIQNPWQTISDSFYFVGDKLVLHTKALFNYAPFE